MSPTRLPLQGIAISLLVGCSVLATTGCAPGLHSVRLRTADGRERTVVPRPHPPVAITQEEFQRATVSLARSVVPVEDPLEFARQRFEVPIRSGWYFYDRRTRQLTPLDPAAAVDSLPADVVDLTRSYLQWCSKLREPGDCLHLLLHGYALDADARFAVAMDIALGSVAESVAANLKGIANANAVRAMIVASIVMYGVLLVAPEPVSKVIAATMTAALVVYLGVDTIYSLRDGWRRLVARTDAATTFDEIRNAGEQFGKLMGANTARILVMVAAAAMGSGTGGVAKLMPTLPGAGQALTFAEVDGVAVGAVESVAIADSGLTLTLAPGAVAMSATGTNSGEGNPGAQPSAATSVPELGRKLEYFLGRATGSVHNVQRSTQMLSQLERIGLPDTPATRQYLMEHLTRVLNDPSNIARIEASGRVIRESLLTGPRGSLKFETIWEGNKLITGNLFGGQ